jgi:chaperonin GroEL|tara:strand:- start:139 stop:1677 length:1539 start_codon:yes stop_codon:yes gene_type:complete
MNETIVKNLNFGNDAKAAILNGIDKLTQAVSSTLGASGKCVILEDATGNPQITKDGVTVANSVILLDPVENMGAKLLKEAARKTVTEAGDGTTTATILAHAILKEANKHSDLNPRDLKQGINLAVEKVVHYLEKHSSKVKGDKIKQVATISANNDIYLGEVINEAFKAVDETGIVIMETHEQPETVVERIEGVQYDKGIISSHFITHPEKGTAELENALVLIIENKVENIRKIQSVLEHVIKNKHQLLIIADVDPQVMTALAMNKSKGNIKVNVIDAPTFGINKKDTLDDLALLTGATVINEDLGDNMDLIEPEHLGFCIKSVSDRQETIIQIEETPEEVKKLIKNLQKQIEKATNPNMVIRLEKRLARLLAKVAIVKVGANSEVELKEKRDRVEDAICATKAAIKEGIVPGGGIALLNAANSITPKSLSEEVLLEAIKAPYRIILENAGILDYEAPNVKGRGLNVVTGKTVSMVKSGIIDPLLVTKSALKNAASVATTIMSTDCVINNLRA